MAGAGQQQPAKQSVKPGRPKRPTPPSNGSVSWKVIRPKNQEESGAPLDETSHPDTDESCGPGDAIVSAETSSRGHSDYGSSGILSSVVPRLRDAPQTQLSLRKSLDPLLAVQPALKNATTRRIFHFSRNPSPDMHVVRRCN